LSIIIADWPYQQYVALPEFDTVTSALNFDTTDCHVTGGCDLYTTKAASADKKLYRNVETTLQSQYESLVKFGASLSSSKSSAYASSLNQSMSSPFGPLSQTSSRRTFAYLIATLNASHPDYDFSHILRPTDFKRERNHKSVMNTLDSFLYNLRPKSSSSYHNSYTDSWHSDASSACPPSPNHAWGPRMWKIIDNQMTLKDCLVFCYSPDEDPYEDEDAAIWSHHYFFFNKQRRRVCYIYLRGISILSHSPSEETPIKPGRVFSLNDYGWTTPDSGAKKRASYWLGDRAAENKWSDEETEEEEQGEEIGKMDASNYLLSDADNRGSDRERSKSTVRGISEDIAEKIEV
jgi:hypothetical protein